MSISDLVPWRNRGRVGVRRNSEDRDDRVPARRKWDIDLFDDFFSGFGMMPFGEESWQRFNPRVDVVEDDREFRVTAELPGLDEKDIDVSLSRDMLTIKGEKKAETEDKGESFYRMERSYGSFQRTIPLPIEQVDTDQVDATYRNGILTIKLPKQPEARQNTRRITVNAR
jgi:HSP20 family protein